MGKMEEAAHVPCSSHTPRSSDAVTADGNSLAHAQQRKNKQLLTLVAVVIAYIFLVARCKILVCIKSVVTALIIPAHLDALIAAGKAMSILT